MRTLNKFILLALAICCFACSEGALSPSLETSSVSDTDAGGGNGQGGPSAGLITAGEWKDLENWDFWRNLGQDEAHNTTMSGLGFNTAGRVSVFVRDGAAQPLRDVAVELYAGDRRLYAARTNNAGRAELFANLYEDGALPPAAELSLRVDGQTLSDPVTYFTAGTNEIARSAAAPPARAELAFIVDATGSMGDELEFLKRDLTDVLQRIGQENANVDVDVATVFYRDENEEYVTRHSEFGRPLAETMAFINEQSAGGGGDFPEAVHSALDVAVNDLQWSTRARARIAFLLLDAPPHGDDRTMNEYRGLTVRAAEKGIRIVPIVASGIDKKTEFLMRLTAIATNGSYVFITDDSGIGNDHLEPTVGEFEVEFLNNLLVRVVGEMVE